MRGYREQAAAIEVLGSLVSQARREGDKALDVFKDTAVEVRSLRQQLERAVGALEKIAAERRAPPADETRGEPTRAAITAQEALDRLGRR